MMRRRLREAQDQLQEELEKVKDSLKSLHDVHVGSKVPSSESENQNPA